MRLSCLAFLPHTPTIIPSTESPIYFLGLLNLLFLAENLLTVCPFAKRMKIFYDKINVVPMFVFELTGNFKFSVHLP